MKSRLVLGTAQFGLDYGVAGGGKVSVAEVGRILQLAKLHHMDTLDTAIEYGDCEQILGTIGVEKWNVITKLPSFPRKHQAISKWVQESLRSSLARLQISQLDGLMLHSPGDLLHEVGNELYAGMQACKEQGLVRGIGVSIYAPTELEAILPRYPMDIVQAPLNVIDRRLEVSGWLSRLHDSGVSLYVRSAFLQGLLLMSADQRPDKFSRWDALWTEWHDWLNKNKFSALKACLDFVLSFPEVHRVLVGVDSSKQLSDIIECLSDERHLPPLSLATEDPDLVNPSRWSAL